MRTSTPHAGAPEPRRRSPWAWLDDRLGIDGLRYPVPEHANSVAYTLGGITLTSFVLLVVTGVYLAQFYDPRPEVGHSSVYYIATEAFAGSLVRGLHYWLSSAFILTLALHLLRTFVTAAYKAPREMTWVSGVLLFVLGGGLLYTGTILKLDQEAVEALEHNNEVANLFGVVGFWFTPEFTASVAQTTRLYVAHVSILPLLLAVLIAVHMLLIKRHRIAPEPWGTADEISAHERDEHPVPFTTHASHISRWALVVLGAALVLVALAPAQLGAAGITGIEITKPPWYFMWLYPLEDWFGLDPLWIMPAVVTVGLLAVPFVDRSRERDPRRRPIWVAIGALFLVAWVFLTIYGAVTEPAVHVG
jgi:quinol-cytochrome oxidoreductase complex cytochrome b subunit